MIFECEIAIRFLYFVFGGVLLNSKRRVKIVHIFIITNLRRKSNKERRKLLPHDDPSCAASAHGFVRATELPEPRIRFDEIPHK